MWVWGADGDRGGAGLQPCNGAEGGGEQIEVSGAGGGGWAGVQHHV